MNLLWIAFSTLTLIPTPVANPSAKDLKHSVALYPLVGAFVGFLLFLIHKISTAHSLQALLALILWVLLTGAFHLDGLGDCLDGWFGGRTPQERQRIMKDAALGVYGMAGITLNLIAKYVLLNQLMAKEDASLWLITIPITARWAVCLSCVISKAPQGNKGLGSHIIGLPINWFLLATVLALGANAPLLKWSALEVFLIAAGVSVMTSLLSKSKIGGLTGDGMGATIELTEFGTLFLACLQNV